MIQIELTNKQKILLIKKLQENINFLKSEEEPEAQKELEEIRELNKSLDKGISINQTQKVINETRKANSYEVGSAGNRFKLYFEDIEELNKKIEKLRKEGYLNEKTGTE